MMLNNIYSFDKVLFNEKIFWLTLFKLQYFDNSRCHYQAINNYLKTNK